MASTRLLTKIVTTAGRISAGAVLATQERNPPPGLATVPPILHLLAQTLSAQTQPDTARDKELASYMGQVALRYGTLRRAVEALAEGRRQHHLLSSEKARAWNQLLSVSPASIEPTLQRHASLLVHMTKWAAAQGDKLEASLDDYLRWLDSPLTASELVGVEAPDERESIRLAPESAPRNRADSLKSELNAPHVVQPSTGDRERVALGAEATSYTAPAYTLADRPERDSASPDARAVRAGVLENKHPTENPALRPIPAKLREAIARLRAGHDLYERALAAIASRDFVLADDLLHHLQGRLDPVELHTLSGDRFTMECRFDEALAHYRTAMSRRPDFVRRTDLSITLMRAHKGNAEQRFREAVELLTDTLQSQHDSPPAWALTHALLAHALHHAPAPPDGDRSASLRDALASYEAAATVFTRDADPDWWADLMVHRAKALLDLPAPAPQRGENTSRAVALLHQAAEAWTRETDPERWATIQCDLGHAWERCPTGDRQENLARAIEHYEAALSARSREHNPAGWATVQGNLGACYSQAKGPTDAEFVENVRRAIACHSAALEVWTRENRRTEWGATQNNLGNAWALMPAKGEEREKNLRRAISCYRSALDVRARAVVPWDWASTMNNMGMCLLMLAPPAPSPAGQSGSPGDTAVGLAATPKSAEPLREAIACFRKALEVRTREASPQEWAKTQTNLGTAWTRVPEGSRIDNLEEAMGCFKCALEVFTADQFPGPHRNVTQKLNEARTQLRALGEG